MTETAQPCELCGEPMPEGEPMFKYHGYSGPCPKPPQATKTAQVVHRWAKSEFKTRCGIVLHEYGIHGEHFYNTSIEIRGGRLRYGERECGRCARRLHLPVRGPRSVLSPRELTRAVRRR